jgi:hypothetical protein
LLIILYVLYKVPVLSDECRLLRVHVG